jgi:hypothetical protein
MDVVVMAIILFFMVVVLLLAFYFLLFIKIKIVLCLALVKCLYFRKRLSNFLNYGLDHLNSLKEAIFIILKSPTFGLFLRPGLAWGKRVSLLFLSEN